MATVALVNRVSSHLAYWRELHHPGERRFWRCRPTPVGVQIQFRDEEESEWGSRVLAFVPPTEARAMPRQHVASHLGGFDSADVSPVHQFRRRMEAAARDALTLVNEQLAEGFVDVSRDAGVQLWEFCEELWRFESNDTVLVDRLCAEARAVSEETRLRVGHALTVRAAGPWTTSLDGGGPQTGWWPLEPTDEERARALSALCVQPDEAALLLLALRIDCPTVADDAMQALAGVGVEDALGFAVLYDLLVHPGLYYALPHAPLMALAHRIAPRTEWIEALVAYGTDAPTATGARLSADERHFQRGFQAFAIVARWSRSDEAAEALRVARPLTSKQCVLIAAETHPRGMWVESLARQRKYATVDQRARYNAAIAACRAADPLTRL